MEMFNIEYDVIDSSKRSLRTVVLHINHQYSPLPVGLTTVL